MQGEGGSMITVYSSQHAQHNPTHEYCEGQLIPYTEAPQRAETIRSALESSQIGRIIAPDEYAMDVLRRVHTADYLDFLQTIYADWIAIGGTTEAVMPSAMPRQGYDRPSASPFARAGEYLFDLSAPITATTFEAAAASAACALTAADYVCNGERVAYALCRPPGHHAYASMGGGFCYLNNAAIAAEHLITGGAERVAILDIDVHHGNGTQSIFEARSDVLFISIHGHPDWEYPYFSGHADETGTGAGQGYTLSLPLARHTDDVAYLGVLDVALAKIREYAPQYLIVSAGFDTYIEDSMSQINLTTACYEEIAHRLRQLDIPSVVVQEGGYHVAALGENVVRFLRGFVG